MIIKHIPGTVYLNGKMRTTGMVMEHEANARLIAAAPDLLQALEEIARIAWHSESEGKPDLSHAGRWRIVNIAREAFARGRERL